MSRGLGATQRQLVDQLRALNTGAGVLPGNNGGNTRRAAHTLARRGLVTIEYMTLNGRQRLVIRLTRRRG